ncbi:MAG: lysophospholipid acyltransferase family protein [Steroidobacterales bacterium]
MLRGWIYGAYGLVCFGGVAGFTLLVSLLVIRPRTRRKVAAASARLFLRLARIPFQVVGLEHLPGTPCVVVANHASYIDGLVASAALPPDFAFVIKKEMVAVPLASTLLRRLGSEFVERFDRHKGAADARRVLRRAADGQSMVFFPEGTFNETRQVGEFLRGAFTTAARAGLPVVAVAIHGTRDALPPGSLRLRRRPLKVQVLGILHGPDTRQRSRELIARAIGEPLA